MILKSHFILKKFTEIGKSFFRIIEQSTDIHK